MKLHQLKAKAKVSSEHQRDDLERQITDLRQRYPGHEIISDIGSGLNWKRRGFVTLLERIYSKGVEEVVVTRKDRLCRFGSELVEWIFEKNGTRLVVLGSEIYTNDSEYGELAEDLLAIVTVFVAKLPKRFKSFKKEVQKLSTGKVRRIRIYPNK